MLIISRRIDESLVLEFGGKETATIKMLRMDGNQVRVGISAPKHISVVRGEIIQKAAAEESGDLLPQQVD